MGAYDPDDFFSGGGKSFKFDRVGASITGVVKRREVRQQTDFKTGKPLFFEDGTPRKQLIVTVSTDLRDPEDEHDKGDRNVYVKGKMVATVRDAIKAGGADKLEDGGILTVTFVEQDPPARKGEDGQKHYAASYVSAATAALMGSQPPAAAPVAPPAAPATPPPPPAALPDAQAAAAAALAALSPEQRKALGLG